MANLKASVFVPLNLEMRHCCLGVYLFHNIQCAAHYLRGDRENAAIIISVFGNEITEPFAAEFFCDA